MLDVTDHKEVLSLVSSHWAQIKEQIRALSPELLEILI